MTPRQASAAVLWLALVTSALLMPGAPPSLAQTVALHAGAQPRDASPYGPLVKNIKVIQPSGGRVDWSPSGNNLIAWERVNADRYTDVYTMQPDGTHVISVTEGNPGIAQRNNGNPVWHPSGAYIVFQSEAAQHVEWPNVGFYTGPGAGWFNNLWATTPTGSAFWQLTFLPVKQVVSDTIPVEGVYNAHFSHDGHKLTWTEFYAPGGNLGNFRLKIADFLVGPNGPYLANERILLQQTTGADNYVAPMAFSPDDTKLLVAGNLDGQNSYGMDEYILDLATGTYTNLTNTPTVWEEDATWSPDGQKIVYLNNTGSTLDPTNPTWQLQSMLSDYYMMNADGSNKTRLTFFNDPTSPEYIGAGLRVIAGDCSFSPDGRYIVGKYTVYSGLGPTTRSTSLIILIELNTPLGPSPTPTPTAPSTGTATPSATPTGTPLATLTLGSASAAPYQTLAITGTAFGVGEPINIYWDTRSATPLSTTVTTASGVFTASVRVPEATGGTHNLTARGQSSGDTATAFLAVKPLLVLNPTTGPAGAQVTVMGFGFAASEGVMLAWDTGTQILGRATTNGAGSFAGTAALTITVPTGATGGSHVLYGVGQNSSTIAGALFTLR